MSGVLYHAPPDHLILDVQGSIAKAIQQLPPGKRTALVGVATTEGANAAIVAKIDEHWVVQAWIGKTWGDPLNTGAQVMASW
jgi:hypothetical protein